MDFDKDLARKLHSRNILLSYNGRKPSETNYEWLNYGKNLSAKEPITIESNCGFFGGTYSVLVGGGRSAGLCSMGSFSYSYSPLPVQLTVGRYCSISDRMVILDSYHPLDFVTTSIISFRGKNKLVAPYTSKAKRGPRDYKFKTMGTRPYPTIEHDVWIGSNVTLSMGITLGTGCVVAANSVVSKSVPPYAIVGGNPARIIRYRFDEKTINDLLESKWWEYAPDSLLDLNIDDTAGFVGRLDNAREYLEKYDPNAITIGPNKVETE